MAKLKVTKTSAYSSQVVDKYVSPTIIDGAHIGGTGGLTSQSGYQIQPQVYITGGSSLPGSIVAQKGAHKFQVTDGTLTGKCTLTNSPNLVAGQMNVLINLSTVSANVASANVAGGATSTYVTWTGTPVGPITTPRVGDYIIGFTGAAGVAQVTAINTTSNVTIAVSGNVAAQNLVAITDSTYASRITNKFAYDFGGNKLRYRLATPDATFVQVQSA